jgi:hypothetical protein
LEVFSDDTDQLLRNADRNFGGYVQYDRDFPSNQAGEMGNGNSILSITLNSPPAADQIPPAQIPPPSSEPTAVATPTMREKTPMPVS